MCGKALPYRKHRVVFFLVGEAQPRRDDLGSLAGRPEAFRTSGGQAAKYRSVTFLEETQHRIALLQSAITRQSPKFVLQIFFLVMFHDCDAFVGE